MPKKQFEKQGYSAIGKVFQRDAAIAPSAPPVEPKVVVEPEPRADPRPPREEPLATTQPVVELKPVPAAVPIRAQPPIEGRSERAAAKSVESLEPGQVRLPRSTRAGGRLPAIRVECEPDEFADFQAMVFNLGRAAGHKLSHNILGRALVRISLELEDEIRKAAEKNPPRARPANGNAEELARHEDEWEQAVREAMRLLSNRRSR